MKMEPERRAVREHHVDSETRTIEGYAALFGSPSVDLGGFIETIERGAFSTSLRDAGNGAQIFAYWNHNSDYVLGSTRSGKLALEEDDRGLKFRLDASRLTPQQLDAVGDGDMQMSFGFSVRGDGQQWERRDGMLYRTLTDIIVSEISPVSTPAYQDTSAALRSAPDHLKVTDAEREQARRNAAAAQARIAARRAEQEQKFRGIN